MTASPVVTVTEEAARENRNAAHGRRHKQEVLTSGHAWSGSYQNLLLQVRPVAVLQLCLGLKTPLLLLRGARRRLLQRLRGSTRTGVSCARLTSDP